MERKHEREYYWGLALLALSCLSLVWALWRDAFRPEVFLAGFLLFSWGYALLWRHDINQSLSAMRNEIAELRSRLADEEHVGTVAWAQELIESTPDPEIPPANPGGGETLLPTEF